MPRRLDSSRPSSMRRLRVGSCSLAPTKRECSRFPSLAGTHGSPSWTRCVRSARAPFAADPTRRSRSLASARRRRSSRRRTSRRPSSERTCLRWSVSPHPGSTSEYRANAPDSRATPSATHAGRGSTAFSARAPRCRRSAFANALTRAPAGPHASPAPQAPYRDALPDRGNGTGARNGVGLAPRRAQYQ
jgi:hypothetical protein